MATYRFVVVDKAITTVIMAKAFFVENPFAVSIGNWIWGNTPNPNISPEICLSGLPWNLSADCSMQVLVKAMGLAMILGACGNKFPTLVNIVQSKSVAGLPKKSIYGETIIAANATLYGYLQRFPWTAYGENVAITIQCVMVMLLMWQYSDSHKMTDGIVTCMSLDSYTTTTPKTTRMVTTLHEKVSVTCLSICYVYSVIYFLPPSLHYLLMSSVMPLMIYARGSQISEAYTIQHTGAQSIVTTAISLGGNLGRILTTIKEVGFDRAALSWYFVSAFLNSIMAYQYLHYRKNTNVVLDELRRQKTHVLPKEA